MNKRIKNKIYQKMGTKYFQRLSIAVVILASLMLSINAQSSAQSKKPNATNTQKKNTVKYKVTFIELGSVRCIPCQKMQSVMKSVKEKYPNLVNVIFYDVWTPEGKPFGQQSAIQVIPTQIFLDENGKEFFRHEGYFPEEELVKVLKTNGVK